MLAVIDGLVGAAIFVGAAVLAVALVLSPLYIWGWCRRTCLAVREATAAIERQTVVLQQLAGRRSASASAPQPPAAPSPRAQG
jgi:hypothetical protein